MSPCSEVDFEVLHACRRDTIQALLFLLAPSVLLAGRSDELIHYPMVIHAVCPGAASGEMMLGAAYLAMKQFNWEVVLAQADYFRAKYCRGGPSGFCIAVDVFFTEEKLEFWMSPQQPPRSKTRRTAVDWIGNVQGVFGDYQCGDPEGLIEAYSSLVRRKKPTWAVSLNLEKSFREKGEFRRWFEWHDKYNSPSVAVTILVDTGLSLAPGGEEIEGFYVPMGGKIQIIEKSASWYRVKSQKDAAASFWIHESKIDITPDQIQQVIEQMQANDREENSGPEVVDSYSNIEPTGIPSPKANTLDVIETVDGGHIYGDVVEISDEGIKVSYPDDGFIEIFQIKDVERITFGKSGRIQEFTPKSAPTPGPSR